MNVLDKHDTKLYARFAILFPKSAGTRSPEVQHAFVEAMAETSPDVVLEAVSWYRCLCQIKFRGDFSVHPMVKGALNWLRDRKYEEEYEAQVRILLGDKNVHLDTPQALAEREKIAQAIKDKEERRQKELDEKAREAKELYPQSLVNALAGRKAMK